MWAPWRTVSRLKDASEQAATFTFALTPAQIGSITGGPGAQATLSVTASRDIGHKAGDAPNDMLATAADGVPLGNLFTNTIDSCPAGERGTNYPADTVCGPNYHTDVKATDQLSIGTADITSIAADGTVNVVLTPSAQMGRLKIFDVELLVTQVPEPTSYAFFAGGLVVLGLLLRAKKS
jgi:PEP-CTERM motif-containing protein